MKRPIKTSPRQLRLTLEHETPHQPAEQLREELVKILAELLVEALGDTSYAPAPMMDGCRRRRSRIPIDRGRVEACQGP